MSAMAGRLQQFSTRIRNRLPALLVPVSDDKERDRQQTELAQFATDLGLLRRDLKSEEHRLLLLGRSKSSDPWAQKQRLIDIKLEKEQAEALARLIEDQLRARGMNPMEVGHKIHELIENSDIHFDEAEQAIIQARITNSSSIGPPTPPPSSSMTPLQMMDSAVPMLTFAWILLRWVKNKNKKGGNSDQTKRRAS